MKKKILQINLDDEHMSFIDSIKKYELQLASEIVSKICDAIDEGLSYVDIVTINSPYHKITLHAQEKNYIETLEINKETLIKYEEFELCARAVKCAEKLKEKNLSSK
jgi:hypothetical protein